MATKTTTDQPMPIVEQTPVEQIPIADTQDDLDYLLVEQRRIAEAIKQAKASLPQQTPLEKVVAKQTASYEKFIPKGIANRTLARMRAGQDRESALREVVAFFVARAAELLDDAAATGADADNGSDRK